MNRFNPTRPTVFIAHPSDMLTDHLPNGDGLVAYGFLRELAARGYRLHIATPGAALRQGFPANVTLHEIPRRFKNPILNRLHYIWSIRGLLRQLRRQEHIDLVHQMNPVFAGLSLGLIGCRLPVILGTYVARWPGGEASEAGRGKLRRMVVSSGRWFINLLQQLHASVLLITTPAALNRISVPSLVRRKIALLRHGIDEQLFSPGNIAAPSTLPSILFYSHIDHRKGVFVLVEAFRTVLREIPACRLVLIGRGDHVNELRQAIEASGCGDHIELRGPVPRSEAPTLIAQHSVYCLPSFGEPYATTVLEAMACGRAIVVTNSGGLPHMVPEVGGLFVPPADASALADALITVLRSPEMQVRMGAANRAHIERHHTWSAVVDELEAIYARATAPGTTTQRASAVVAGAISK